MENKRNLYVIPTDKPSNLTIITKTNELIYSYRLFIPKNGSDINVNLHIYITSDEEIKDDEWHLHYYEGKPVISKSHNGASEYINLKAKEFGYNKIIMATDDQLIKDGVQAIDDEFIEWFVKNPSCENVEVKMENYYASGALQPNLWQYKIIIPQEEPKQETTLEEAAEKYAKTAEGIDIPYQNGLYYGFVEGAKWQSERMYSEEEVLNFTKYILSKEVIIARSASNVSSYLPKEFQLLSGELEHNGKEILKEWFEQFKKK